jgi:hypothetical protein
MIRASSSTLRWRALITRDAELGAPPWPPAATAITLGLALLGAATRLRLYFVNRSLWLDEVFIALNLSRRSFAELAKPLYNQGAPLGFLWIEKAVTGLLGNAEWVLRLRAYAPHCAQLCPLSPGACDIMGEETTGTERAQTCSAFPGVG